ncbi:response regulator [Candidatus Albibeggiatoa sp. nov. NOAA]|uniref:response regulator n=1 Tax=Candidatus Albibeggiatoa sp. nov. NOAA TaxID=3162724 RepID=UPI0032F87E17|nr:response regulator [Thiotrichaceae bacterium]
MTSLHQKTAAKSWQFIQSCCTQITHSRLYQWVSNPIQKIFHSINRYWHHSIQRQLVLGIALVHAVLMTIFILDLTERERHFLQEQSIQQAIALSEMLAANSSSWVLASDVVGLSEILSYQKRYPGLDYAMVISKRGQVLAHTSTEFIGRYLNDKTSHELLRTNAQPFTQMLWQTERYLDIASPIMSSGQLIGWARVGISTNHVVENLKVATRNGLLYTILAILVGIVFAVLMARGLTAGMKNLLDVTDKVRQGERQVRADETRYDEVGRLGTAFNEMVIAIDKSDRELTIAKEAAEESNRAKSQFIANMSHELRTPLNAIIGYSDMLHDEIEDLEPDEIAPDLAKINAAGRHLLSLINDILDLSKIESGKMEIYNETFDIQKVLEEVIVTVQILLEQRHNTLAFDCEPNIGLMHSDVTKVRQILLNLLSNASKFTENGTVGLKVRKQWIGDIEWISFSITDTGIGISREQQKKLFKAFSQVDASTTRKYGGTGLGLLITKRFAEMMGGQVSVESELGRGSTFVVRFPTKMASRQTIPELEHTLPVVQDEQATILVIDDDEHVRDLLSKHIQHSGYHVVTAANGEDGLQLAHQLKPQLITLDVMMPQMDGWVVLSELKSHPQVQHIPVVMLSMVENHELGYSLGAAEYLLKPVDQHQIAQVLNKYRNSSSYGKILIVEDDAMIRDMIKQMLQKDGWEVVFANNGKMGLEKVKTQQPDIILLDLMMPEMDGYEFISQLREQKQQRKIPIIVLTAKDITTHDRQYLSSEVHTIFQKGAYKREELLSELHDLLAQAT